MTCSHTSCCMRMQGSTLQQQLCERAPYLARTAPPCGRYSALQASLVSQRSSGATKRQLQPLRISKPPQAAPAAAVSHRAQHPQLLGSASNAIGATNLLAAGSCSKQVANVGVSPQLQPVAHQEGSAARASACGLSQDGDAFLCTKSPPPACSNAAPANPTGKHRCTANRLSAFALAVLANLPKTEHEAFYAATLARHSAPQATASHGSIRR